MNTASSSMIRLAVTGLVLLTAPAPARADEPVQEWYDQSIGGNNGALDSQGNVATGLLHETYKFSADGTLLWTQPFDIPTDHTLLHWLAVDSSDNVIRGGYQEGGGGGYLAVKYDPSGNELWWTIAPGTEGGQAFRVAVDEYDDMYLFGEAYQGFAKKRLTVKIDKNGQVQWLRWTWMAEPVEMAVRDGKVVVTAEAGGGDYVTTAYGYDGALLWESIYEAGTSLNHVAIGADGQVVVCGWGMSSISPGSAGTVVQYDAVGNERWATEYNGPYGGVEIFHRVAVDDDGFVIAAGYGLSSAPDDAWSIVKLDPAGQVVWTFLYDNVTFTGWEYAYSLAVGEAGAIYAGGLSDRHASCGFGSLEGQLIKLDSDGALEWHHHLPCGSYPRTVLLDGQGGVVGVTLGQVIKLRERFVDLGAGLAGANGLPKLTGSGTLVAGAPVTLTLSGAKAGAPATRIVGLVDVGLPLLGGTLVPSADVMIPLVVGGGGTHVLSAPWPTGVPAAVHLYMQDWIADPAGSFGYAASNGLQVNP